MPGEERKLPPQANILGIRANRPRRRIGTQNLMISQSLESEVGL